MENNFKNAHQVFKTSDEIVGLTVGTSMLPLFRSDKDMAVVKKIDRPLKVNDVLLYRKKGTDDEYILHRLIKLKKDGYVIRGDNLYINECNVSDHEIIGVMVGFHRDGKYYECDKSLKYKLYVVYIRISYPARFIFKKIRPILSRIKRKFFVKK